MHILNISSEPATPNATTPLMLEYGNGYWQMENIDRHALNAVTLTFDTLTHLAVKDLLDLLETNIPTVLTVLNRMETHRAVRNVLPLYLVFLYSINLISQLIVLFPPWKAISNRLWAHRY